MLQINYGLIMGANEESMNEGNQRVVNKLIDLLLLGKPPKNKNWIIYLPNFKHMYMLSKKPAKQNNVYFKTPCT